jgi:hypothetical protein
MDNFTIDVVSEGAGGVGHALALLWGRAAGGKATHYAVVKLKDQRTHYVRPAVAGRDVATGIVAGVEVSAWSSDAVVEAPDGRETLVLLWHEEAGAVALPFPLNQAQAVEFVVGWLGSVSYGREPDHDGDNGKGWRVFTGDWGKVGRFSYSFAGIQPAWAMYGK